MKLKLPIIFSQRDNRWASILLGHNTNNAYTIGMYGCLITCLGMYVNKTPEQVNTILKEHNGFTSGSGNFIWSHSQDVGLTQQYASPKWDGPVTAQGITKAKELLDGHYPLLCEVDFNPATVGEEMHFVLCTGYDGDTFFIADPWTGTEETFDKYGGFTRAVISYRAYNVKLPAGEDAQPTINILQTLFEEVELHVLVAAPEEEVYLHAVSLAQP